MQDEITKFEVRVEGRERGGKREGLKVKETETDLSPKNGEKWESYGRVNSANTKLETKTRLACIYRQYISPSLL